MISDRSERGKKEKKRGMLQTEDIYLFPKTLVIPMMVEVRKQSVDKNGDQRAVRLVTVKEGAI